MANIAQVAKDMANVMDTGRSVMLVGPPGCGKTSIVSQYAESSGSVFLHYNGETKRAEDVGGYPVADLANKKALWLPIGELAMVTDPVGPPVVVLFDDIGRAPMDMQGAVSHMICERKFGDYNIRDNVRFALATNPVAKGMGVRAMLDPLVDRPCVLEVEYSEEAWIDWASQCQDIPASVIAYAKWRTETGDGKHRLFATRERATQFDKACTPRGLHNAAKSVAQGHSTAVLSGWIGKAVAYDLAAFVKSQDEVSIPALLMQPAKVQCKDVGLQYAIAARVAVHPNLQEAFRLVDHMAKLMAVSCVSMMTERREHIKQSREFINWAKNNKEVLL